MMELANISRIARTPIAVPSGVDVKVEGRSMTVKGVKGELKFGLSETIKLEFTDAGIRVLPLSNSKEARAMVGTTAALVRNMVCGVSQGFEKKLLLVGVGYRAQLQGATLILSLGLSHTVEYKAPEGVSFELPSQTEILIKGADKQLVGQTAAEIRAFRRPEPYKGKGVRYADEVVILKETKKK